MATTMFRLVRQFDQHGLANPDTDKAYRVETVEKLSEREGRELIDTMNRAMKLYKTTVKGMVEGGGRNG